MTEIKINRAASKLEISFPSLVCYLEPVVGEIVEFIEEKECRIELFSLRLVMFEALTNAVVHGNKCNELLEVSALVTVLQDRLTITIADSGDGFNWEGEMNKGLQAEHIPNGRGLIILQKYEFNPTYNEAGNVLSLEKIFL